MRYNWRMTSSLRAWRPLTAALLITGIAVSIAASAPRTQVTTPAQAPTLALVGGTLIDGHGGPPIPNSVVLVEGSRITGVGRVGSLAVPRGATVVSTQGQYLLPGLWDMH